MSNLLILGAGGHAKVIADAAYAMRTWQSICFLDDKNISNTVSPDSKISIVGKFKDLPKLRKDFSDAVVAIGDNKQRARLIAQCQDLGFSLPVIIHHHSWVSKSAKIGLGSVVFAGVVINASAQIGVGSIVNTAAIIEHDCIIEDYVHISPNAALAGAVKVGEYSWIGIGASVIHKITIGRNVIIGAGAAVIGNISDNVVAVGVPAKIIKANNF